MPRKPGVWFREFDGFFYTTIRKKKIKLSKDKTEADAEFYRLMAEQLEQPEEPKLTNGHPTKAKFAAIANAFLVQSQENNEVTTYRMHRRFLKSFAAHCARLRFCDLTPFKFNRWVARHRDWNDGAKRGAVNVIKACLNWWCNENNIPTHPLQRLKPPPDASRVVVISEENQKRALDCLRSTDPFRYYFVALQQTGARPSEVRKVKPEHFDPIQGLWVMKGKTTRKTGKKRVIFLTPVVVEICKQMIQDNKDDGPIFRHRNGGPWSKGAIEFRFMKLAEKLNLPELTSYSLRHSFCTLALMRGVEVAHVATLMGHAGTRIVLKHYSHLQEQISHMRAQAMKANGTT